MRFTGKNLSWVMFFSILATLAVAEAPAVEEEEEEEEEKEEITQQQVTYPSGKDPSLALDPGSLVETKAVEEKQNTEEQAKTVQVPKAEDPPSATQPPKEPDSLTKPPEVADAPTAQTPPKEPEQPTAPASELETAVEKPSENSTTVLATEPEKVAPITPPDTPPELAKPTPPTAPEQPTVRIETPGTLPTKIEDVTLMPTARLPDPAPPQAALALIPPVEPSAPKQAPPKVNAVDEIYYPGPYRIDILTAMQIEHAARIAHNNIEINLRRIPVDSRFQSAPQESPTIAPSIPTELPIITAGLPEVSVILNNGQFIPARFRLKSGIKAKLYFTSVQKKPSALVIERLSVQRWIAQHDYQFSNLPPHEKPGRENEPINREINSQKTTEILLDPKPGTYGFHDPLSGARGEIIVE